jgi:hypothetical protein
MTDTSESRTNWKSLPPLRGGVWVAMVTDVLDQQDIPNIVKTDLTSGGLGQITGTEQLGKGWRIQVPEEFYEEALGIFDSLMGDSTPEADES